MVLDHVAQRAGGVVVAGALLQADGFGHGDLHVVDPAGVPQGFEQDIGEAQRQQVLDRFLAQVVVDAEDLAFGERAADGVVDDGGAGRIVADRLLDHHAGVAGVQAVRAQAVADGDEQGGAGGQVEHPDALAGGQQAGGELVPALVLGGIQGQIAELVQEGGQPGLEGFVGSGDAGQRFAHLGPVLRIALSVAGHAQDAAVFRNLAIGIAAQQAG